MVTGLGIFFFLIGLAIGSFLNVVILRYNTGFGFEGRSQCFSCGKELRWFELVPLFSFLVLRGKCARCGSKISWQYPLAELSTGLLFLAVYLQAKSFIALSFASFAASLLYGFILFSILTIVFVYDLRHKIIPDLLVFLLALIGLIHIFVSFFPLGFRMPLFQDLLAGPILAAPFAFIWLISQGKWMGFGDAKLALAIGWIVGLTAGLSALVFSFWIGAVVGIMLILIERLSFGSKRLTMKSEIPFAPFLIIGLAIVFFFDISVMSLSELLIR